MGLWSDIQAGEAIAKSLVVPVPGRSALVAISLIGEVNTPLDGVVRASFNPMREPDIGVTKDRRDGIPRAVDAESGTITLERHE